MSHFSVLVIGEDIEGQLAPYDENMKVERYKERVDTEDFARFVSYYGSEAKGIAAATAAGVHPVTDASARGAWAALSEGWSGRKRGWDEEGPFTWSTYNPKSKWDWYTIGGRWRGAWKLKVGAGAAVLGEPGSFDNRPKHDADQARKGDIDFDGIEAEEARKAALDWGRWEPLLKLPAAAPWAEFVARVEAKELDIEEARRQYHALRRKFRRSRGRSRTTGTSRRTTSAAIVRSTSPVVRPRSGCRSRSSVTASGTRRAAWAGSA
jgi:hypothetical protein